LERRINMKRFWLFRSNLRHLEYYHKFRDLETFEENCHDFYMLFPIWLLRNNYFDEVVIWRLSKVPIPEIVFYINDKRYIQRWVGDLKQVFNHSKPDISFFRGGFEEYDRVTQQNPKYFGLKLYLATGKRIYPQWHGIYDIFPQEDKRDMVYSDVKTQPFYKTASPKIFHPEHDFTLSSKKYDICWPCNFKQIRYKGQEDFISKIAYTKLKNLKIIHCGNQPEIGNKLCKKYGVTNIKFSGEVDRVELNYLLNRSKFGLCMSNQNDGCPRVVTEILQSGTPLFIRNLTRLLPYYKQKGIVEVDENFPKQIIKGLENYEDKRNELIDEGLELISFDKICKKNIDIWLS
jgi:Glycosyl transferases group 1